MQTKVPDTHRQFYLMHTNECNQEFPNIENQHFWFWTAVMWSYVTYRYKLGEVRTSYGLADRFAPRSRLAWIRGCTGKQQCLYSQSSPQSPGRLQFAPEDHSGPLRDDKGNHKYTYREHVLFINTAYSLSPLLHFMGTFISKVDLTWPRPHILWLSQHMAFITLCCQNVCSHG